MACRCVAMFLVVLVCLSVSVPGLSMISRLNVCLWICLGVTCAGCGSSSGPSPGSSIVSCSTPTQTKTWLLSEVDDSFDSHPDASFSFPFWNQTGHPVTLRVRSIGCSCYQVKHGATRLKIDDQFEIGTDATETLILYSPRPTVDRVADYHFSVEYDLKPGFPTQIISCKGVLVSVSEVRVNPGVLTAEFVKDSPNQKVRLEVTRTARQREVAAQRIAMSGWPPGTVVEEPEPLGEATEVLSGLWKRSWRVTALIPKPEPTTTPQEFWPISVTGAEPGSPQNVVQLMVRFRSGLSGPRIVHFGEVAIGKPVTRRIQILARDDQPFRILGPSDSHEVLSLQADSSEAMKAHWGNLTMTPQAIGDFRQIMQVTTDHPEQASLAVEVRANVRQETKLPETTEQDAKP